MMEFNSLFHIQRLVIKIELLNLIIELKYKHII